MGSTGTTVFPRAVHRAPSIWEGFQEYCEEQQTSTTCLICESETCPGASGRVCIYEVDACSSCGDHSCISNLGHDCPWDDRCDNCGNLRHPLWYNPMDYATPNCDMPSMELCPDCGSATCKVNPPQAATPRVEEYPWYPDDYYVEDLHAERWDSNPILTKQEEIDDCWARLSTNLSPERVEAQIQESWDIWWSNKLADCAGRPAELPYQLYELQEDFREGNLPEELVLSILRGDPRGFPILL